MDKILEGNPRPALFTVAIFGWYVSLMIPVFSLVSLFPKFCTIKMCHFSNQKTSMKLLPVSILRSSGELCRGCGSLWGEVSEPQALLKARHWNAKRSQCSKLPVLQGPVHWAQASSWPSQALRDAKGAVALPASSSWQSSFCSGQQARAGVAEG